MRFRPSILTVVLSIVLLGCAMMGALIWLETRTNALRGGIEARMLRADRAIQFVDATEIALLLARREERDFLLRRDESALAAHEAAMTELADSYAEARRIVALLPELAPTLPQFDRFEAEVTAYAARFAEVTTLRRQLGLASGSGLEGQLRAAVEALEDRVQDIEAPALQRQLMTMRRLEKDFLLKGARDFVDRLNEVAGQVLRLPAEVFPAPGLRAEVNALLDDYRTTFDAFAETSIALARTEAALTASFAAAEPIMEEVRHEALAAGAAIRSAGLARTEAAKRFELRLGLVMVAIFVALAVTLALAIARPLRKQAAVISAIREGDLEQPLPASPIREIDGVTQAVQRFRDDLADQARLIADLSEVIDACAAGDFSRRLPEDEHFGNCATMVRGVNLIGESAERGLGDVGDVLESLARGDLTAAMPAGQKGIFQDMSGVLDKVNANLVELVRQLADSSAMLDRTAREIASAGDDTSHRVQNSAASLEETAAALRTLDDTVRHTTGNVRSTQDFVGEAREETTRTRALADRAVDAIRKIEESSGAIGQITGMIEDVAFQTNLLALNAGVEAARAGEAGRGFAVVASEVRALAQRASSAAQEINGLIRDSRSHVTDGVKLVAESGAALGTIQDSVVQMVGKMDEIASAAQEQATGIAEISTAIGSLDRDTQNNAAMLEQSAAAGQNLRDEAASLVRLVQRFTLPGTDRPALPAPVDHPATGMNASAA
ncbi:HAMP domain-containing protein [Aquicoccus sp. SCR17]|nr:HAMP domain-containing protein [Carideicomes alvinocaridis]